MSFTLVWVLDGVVGEARFDTCTGAFQGYRARVLIMELYAEDNPIKKPRAVSSQYKATNIVSLYSPTWTELASTRCQPWENHR